MKVVAIDNLNRDYKPEKLVAVNCSSLQANTIAEALNSLNEEDCYKVVGNEYVLNLSSMYDVIDDNPPESFYIEQLSLNALLNEPNISIKIN